MRNTAPINASRKLTIWDKTVNNAARCLAMLLIAGALPSCVSLQVRAGRRPNTDLLESQLTLGKSSEADVSRILGAPLGRGRVALPHHSLGQTDNMWTYYYEEGTLEESRRVFLFVYFDGGRFDGYMWFSSLPPTNPARAVSAERR
jgi:hypothetical protein